MNNKYSMKWPTIKLEKRVLTLYFSFAYLVNLYLCSLFIQYTDNLELSSTTFLLAVCLTYPLIYIAPLIMLSLILLKMQQKQEGSIWQLFILMLALLINALISIVLYSDIRLFDLYGFHINAFVINLIVTPGGVESMGGGTDTYVSAGLFSMAMLVLQVFLYYLAYRLQHKIPLNKQLARVVLFLFLGLALSERVVYGVSDSQQYEPVLKAAAVIPLYNHVTFRSLIQKLGFEVVRREKIRLKDTNKALNYPLKPLQEKDDSKPLNIIWLVSESMRWDMLSKEIMPHTFQQSQSGLRFMHHYSGGNGTRQGLFSLFYGLYGSYWDAFLMAGRSPLLLDLLEERNYKLDMYTSAGFRYPEFDQTLFARLDASQLHQFDNAMSAHERDEANTASIIAGIRERDKTRPFMTFMFYESTHARYDFPKEAVIKTPYLADLNYATMTRKSLASRIGELKNRYINSSHFIDSQLARIFTVLTEENLWENTIVMVTGDHGEEFMEKGFWGHNSGFSEEQIRTPMVLWLPETEARKVEKVSSHMDIVATIMPLLGVSNPPEDYSQGVNLLEDFDRPYIVVSDWAGIAFLNDAYKFTLPFNSSLDSTNELFNEKDEVIDNILPFLKTHRTDLEQVLKSASQFKETK